MEKKIFIKPVTQVMEMNTAMTILAGSTNTVGTSDETISAADGADVTAAKKGNFSGFQWK